MQTKRGFYGEIPLNSLTPTTAKRVEKLVDSVSKAEKVDEHGWDFGTDFDDNCCGEALNWDLYGYGQDFHNRKFLAVIQVRQWSKRSKRAWSKVRKNYYLIGRNEDKTFFAHSIQSQVIYSAIKRNVNVIQACQSWIFGADYKKVIRQGDLALVPLHVTGGDTLVEKGCTLEESHLLVADELRLNGKNGKTLYAKNPKLTHIPEKHPFVTGKGWYKVMVGKRASYWDFASPTVD